MKQLIPPNLDTEGSAGYCLGYVSDVFGLTGTGAWATQCAERSGVRTDALPTDVAVPLFWSGYATAGDGSKGDYGHIALWVPGQGIYSSPASGKGHLIWPDLATATATVSRWMQNATYLGWALDIAGQAVAEDDGTTTTTTEGEDDMKLIQQKDRGVAVIGPGYAKTLTPDELTPATQVWGSPIIFGDDTTGQWYFDLARDAAMKGSTAVSDDSADKITDHVWARGINGGGAAGDRLAGIDAATQKYLEPVGTRVYKNTATGRMAIINPVGLSWIIPAGQEDGYAGLARARGIALDTTPIEVPDNEWGWILGLAGLAKLSLTDDQIKAISVQVGSAQAATVTLTDAQIASLTAAITAQIPTNITLTGKVA